MNIIDIIDKKRLKQELSYEEIKYAFNGYLNEEVEAYQMSALLMAIVLNGMSDNEIFALTDVFINSGDVLDLSDINGITVDKHSTGGVGDKTTLIVGPIVASLGLKLCKMSGRGLGSTGGTIDKLESIPGFRTSLSEGEIKRQVNDIGMVITQQTKNLTPLDKKVYALRDVTGTVCSLPLVASSVMSKKIASGSSKILIDIKIGTGAFMKTEEEARHLSEIMIKIGQKYNRDVRVLITDMNVPLGRAVGNSLEVVEAISILQGHGKNSYLYNVCVELASNLVSMAFNENIEAAKKMVEENINNGQAYEKFLEFVKYQGGVLRDIEISDKLQVVVSPVAGTIKKIDALTIGKLASSIGCQREKEDDIIDHKVGVVIHRSIGDQVKVGDKLCTLYLGDREFTIDPLEAFVIE